MNDKNTSWEKIEKWIKSVNSRTSFNSMPQELLSKLDKESCLKIMRENLLGHDENEAYNIEYLPEHLKSDLDVGVLAIELFQNNIFELNDSVCSSEKFHTLLSQNPEINYRYIFGHSPSAIRGNKLFVNKIIPAFPSVYDVVTSDLKNDKEILIKVLEAEYLPQSLPQLFSNDKSIVLKLIELFSKKQKEKYFSLSTSYLISFISDELLNDRDILINLYGAVKHIKISIPEHLIGDEEITYNAVKSYPVNYENLDDKLKINHKVAVEAFKGDFKLFLENINKHSFQFKTILEFVISIEKPKYSKWEFEFGFNSEDFEKIVDKLVENNFFIRDIAKHLSLIWPSDIFYYKYFRILSPELKKDKKILRQLLDSSVSEDMLFFHKSEKNYEDYVTTEYVYKKYIQPLFPNDKEFTLTTMYNAPSLFNKIPEILLEDEAIIIKTTRYLKKEKLDEFIQLIPPLLREKKTFILKLLKAHRFFIGDKECLLKIASNQMLSNSDFIKSAIKVNPIAINYASDKLKNDIDIQKLAFKSFRIHRNQLRKSHMELWSFHRTPFANGKSNDVLDIEFIEEKCKNLISKGNLYQRLNNRIAKSKVHREDLPF